MKVIGQTDNFQSYSYNNLGISLKKPLDWAFVSLKNGLQLVKEKNVVYLEIRKSNSQLSNTTLGQLANNDIQERFSSRKGFQLLNLSQANISGNLPAYKAVYEFLKTPDVKPPTNEGATNKVLRMTTIANGVAYIVKYVSEKNKYDSYLPIAEKIIHSLKFNNVNPTPDEKHVNNNNNNDNNYKSNKLKECNSDIAPPCILADGSIAYDCNDSRHFKSQNEQCIYWNNKTGGWDLRLTLGGDNNNNHKSNDAYACRFAEAKIVESNKNLPVCKEKIKGFNNSSKITVGYGDLGGYNGKAKIVIKNLHTGETLVKHDINFAKLRASEGNDCCYKVYTFDKSRTHYGDRLSIRVTGGGGSWEDDAGYTYKDNLKIGMTLDEIGEDVDGNLISNDNHKNKIDYNKDLICDSDKSTKVPSCDKLIKEQEKNNDNNNNDKEEKPDIGPEEDFEVQGNISG
jgi:hypothetical protein